IPLRHHALGPGTWFIFIGADPPDSVLGGPPPNPILNVELTVSFSPPTPPATNESCATPLDVGAGGHFQGSFADVSSDVLACQLRNPDLVYTFTTQARANVHVVAQATPNWLLQLTVRATCGAGTFDDCFLSNGTFAGPRTLERTYYDLAAGTWFLILEDW